MREQDQLIRRIPLKEKDYCAPASMQSSLSGLGIEVTQQGLSCFVHNFNWGTTHLEMFNMAKSCLGKRHVLAKPNWSLGELDELLSSNRATSILDVRDNLKRRCIIPGGKVGGVDGHYIGWDRSRNIKGARYARIIDPSYEDVVVVGAKGAILTEVNNVYYLPFSSLNEIWFDQNENGVMVMHWGIVLLHPEDDPQILEKYRVK